MAGRRPPAPRRPRRLAAAGGARRAGTASRGGRERHCSTPIAAAGCITPGCSAVRRASARRRSPTASPASPSPIPIRPPRRSLPPPTCPYRRTARPSASRRRAPIPISSPWSGRGTTTNKRYKTELAVDEIRRTVWLLRLDQRGRGVADRHRRPRRRDEPERRQRAPQGAGGAADALALLRHQPRARAAAPHHPLALPPARSRAALARRPSPARSATTAASTRTMPTSSSPRRTRPGEPPPRHPAPRGGRHRHLPRLRPLRRHGRRPRRHRHACARRPRLGSGPPTMPITASSTRSAPGSAGASAASPSRMPEATSPAVVRAVPLARWAEVWEKVAAVVVRSRGVNLDRKQVVLSDPHDRSPAPTRM